MRARSSRGCARELHVGEGRASAEAETQVLRIDEWWRSHRRASPDLFDDELDATLEGIVLNPKGVVYE